MRSAYAFFVIFLFGTFSANASHMLGGEILWKRISEDTLEVTAVIIRDCNGVPFTGISLDYSCSDILKISDTLYAAKNVTPICPSLSHCTRCGNSSCTFKYGMEQFRHVYLLDISKALKNGCCKLKLSYSQTNRSVSITTGASLQDFYTESTVDLCVKPYLNSPEFSSLLGNIFCVGVNQGLIQARKRKDTLSNGKELDSFYYSFTQPLQSANKPVNWKSPYSYDKPVSYLGSPQNYPFTRFPFGLHLDSLTGDIYFRPTRTEEAIYTIKIEIYRNGTKIGESRREQSLMVMKCPGNNQPTLNYKALPSSEIKVCANTPINLTFNPTDKDSLDSLSFSVNFPKKNASIIIDTLRGANRPTLNFNWTPSRSDISNKPYTLSINVHDNKCPILGIEWREINIMVVDTDAYTIKPIISHIPNSCGEYSFSGYTSDSSSLQFFDWYLFDTIKIHSAPNKFSTNFNHQFDTNGKYPITIRTKGQACWIEFYDTLIVNTIDNPELKQINDISICLDRMFLDSIKASGGHKPYTFKWSIPDLNKSGNTNSIYHYFNNATAFKTHNIFYSVSDSNNCSASKQFKLIAKELKQEQLVNDTQLCDGLNAKLHLKKYSKSGKSIGSWFGGGIHLDTFYSKNIGLGHHQLSYFGDDTEFCVVDTVKISTKKSIIINIPTQMTICTYSGEYFISTNPNGGIWTGSVISTRNDSSILNSRKSYSNTTMKYIYSYSDSNTCTATDTLTVDWQKGRNLKVGDKISALCEDKNPLILPDRGLPKGGLWYGLGDTSQDLKIDRQIIGHTYYNYEFTDTNGCTSSNKLYVEVLPVSKIKIMKPDTVCIETSYRKGLYAEPKGGNWIGSFINKVNKDSSFISFHNSKLGLHKYYYKITNTNGCKSIDSVFFQVLQQPVSNFIGSPDSGLIPLKVSFKNYSQYSAQYFWDFGNGDTSQRFEPKTTYKDTGVYLVELKTLDSFGFCQHSLKQKVIAGEKNNSVRREFHQVEIFPNPAKNRIWLSNPQNELLTFVIFDHTGKRCKEIITQSSKSINISDLSKGHYIYQTTNSSGLTNQGKLIIE